MREKLCAGEPVNLTDARAGPELGGLVNARPVCKAGLAGESLGNCPEKGQVVGQAPLLVGCFQDAGLRATENLFVEPVHHRVLSSVHLWGPFLQVPGPGSPAAPGSLECSSPSKKTKKATLSADQLPTRAPQEDKVRLGQGLERRVWG